MDIDWLKESSDPSTEKIREFFGQFEGEYYSSRNEYCDVMIEGFASLTDSAGKRFMEELESFSKEHRNFNDKYVREGIGHKLAMYAPLDFEDKEAWKMVLANLEFAVCSLSDWFSGGNSDGSHGEQGASSLYCEVRWILGQVVRSSPSITILKELERTKFLEANKGYNEVYHIIEFIMKVLEDESLLNFYQDRYPEVLVSQLHDILRLCRKRTLDCRGVPASGEGSSQG